VVVYDIGYLDYLKDCAFTVSIFAILNNNEELMKNIMLCLLNTALLVCGQLLFKFTARGKEISSLPDVMQLLLSPYMIAAIILYGVTTLLWVYILTKVPISYAYPIQALAFPLVAMLAVPLFKEIVPVSRWIGIGVILTGVLIASR